MTEKKLAM